MPAKSVLHNEAVLASPCVIVCTVHEAALIVAACQTSPVNVLGLQEQQKTAIPIVCRSASCTINQRH